MSPGASASKIVPGELRPAFRAAATAYRAMRQRGFMDLEASRAAIDAVRDVLPELSRSDASKVATHAVAFAAAHHSDWFWHGVGSAK